MDFKDYKATIESSLPPNLDVGTRLTKVTRVTHNTFALNGIETQGMRVFSMENGKETEYRTSSKVLMSQLDLFFKNHPTETLDNVKVVSPKGKRYLSLEQI